MPPQRPCPACGAAIPADQMEGLCPRCLLRGALGGNSVRPAIDPTTPASSRSGSFVPPTPEELAPAFPQFEILQLIGHGGMGAVYKARQLKLDRIVALKILRPESASDPAFAERFSREARTLAKLNHSHIVAVYDFGEAVSPSGLSEGDVAESAADNGASHRLYYIVMEHVDGANLRDVLQAEGLTPAEALSIVPQICDALQYAHDEGVVHRDIKPENILIDRKGRVHIADFGLARLAFRSGPDFTLTGSHQVMGTPRYMAPEQMEASHAVDHRADIYSLGVVFYEMLTGEVPAGHFDPPSKKVAVDVRLDEVVLRSLAREPERRYQHAIDVRSEVESISQQNVEGHSATVATPVPAADSQEPQKYSGRTSPWPQRIIVLIGAAAALWFSLYHVPWLQTYPEGQTSLMHRPLDDPPHMGIGSDEFGANPIAQSIDFRLVYYRLGLIGICTAVLAYAFRPLPLGHKKPSARKARLARRVDRDSAVGGCDWVTLTRTQIERDEIPNVCMVCGRPARERINKTFEHTSDWAALLALIGFIAAFFPGLIILALTSRTMRVSCPVCPSHRGHWSRLVWVASTGWLLPVLLAALGFWIASAASTRPGASIAGAVGGLAVGLILYLIPVIYLASTRVSVESMTKDEIRLRRVSSAFARGVRECSRAQGLSSEGELRPAVRADAAAEFGRRRRLRRRWDRWWSRRDRWITTSVQVVLIAIFFAGLICYFSFSSTKTAGDTVDGEVLRRTTVTFGYPEPWFEFISKPADSPGFRWQIDWISSSAGLMLMAFTAWCVLWQILKTRPGHRVHWIGSPASIAVAWFCLSLLAVLWGFHPLYIDRLIEAGGL